MSDLDGSAVASLRRLNGSKVLSVLRAEAYRKFTVREMSIATGLSRPTVGRLLDDLVEAGWAQSAEGRPGATGRPARRYSFNRLRGLIASLDVGYAGVGIMITDLVGSELSWTMEWGLALETVESCIDHVMPLFSQKLSEVSADLGLDEDLPVLAVSLSAPVIPDADGVHVDTLSTVNGWRGGSFVPTLRERFGDVPILVNNDILLSAEAELHLGALSTSDQGMFCFLAWFSSIVLIHEGQVHRGTFNLAGDVGSLPEYRWPDVIVEALESSGFNHPASVGRMLEAAANGHEAAQDGIRSVGQGLARGIADVAAMWDPDTIVFAGQLSTAPDLLFEPIESGLRALGSEDFELLRAEVDPEKGSCLGGVIKALDAIDWTV
ncbi:ROK family transcriptional regulator [Galactobacter valiniphilus]|uniref:ROK family transcriptional regulator n=1 Tax=Galactobacter valiniphilus TaxID=2676122 RepID=A0A399JA46_9MICC|nr:ROK family protein [Galactobacter valiniphilus]RII42453.1 ROK family transcriptional regulator [Galactobacter valiniphilus]